MWGQEQHTRERSPRGTEQPPAAFPGWAPSLRTPGRRQVSHIARETPGKRQGNARAVAKVSPNPVLSQASDRPRLAW